MTDSQFGEIIKRLERIERKLGEKNERHWVKVSVVTELTGWTKQGMLKARLNGLITQRKGTNGIEYLLESIPAGFIK